MGSLALHFQATGCLSEKRGQDLEADTVDKRLLTYSDFSGSFHTQLRKNLPRDSALSNQLMIKTILPTDVSTGQSGLGNHSVESLI